MPSFSPWEFHDFVKHITARDEAACSAWLDQHIQRRADVRAVMGGLALAIAVQIRPHMQGDYFAALKFLGEVTDPVRSAGQLVVAAVNQDYGHMQALTSAFVEGPAESQVDVLRALEQMLLSVTGRFEAVPND